MINKSTYKKISSIASKLEIYNNSYSTKDLLLQNIFEDAPKEQNEKPPVVLTEDFNNKFRCNNDPLLQDTINNYVDDYMNIGCPDYWPGWALHRRSEFSSGVSDLYIRKYTKKILSSFFKNINSLGSKQYSKKQIPKAEVNTFYNGSNHISAKGLIKPREFQGTDVREFISILINISSTKTNLFDVVSYGEGNTSGKTFRYFEMKYLNKILKASMDPITKQGGLYLYGIPLVNLVMLVIYSKFPKEMNLLNDPNIIKKQVSNLFNCVSYGTSFNRNNMVYIVTADNPIYSKVLSVPRYCIYERRNMSSIESTKAYVSSDNKSKAFSELTNKDFFDFEMLFKFNKKQYSYIADVIPNLV